jgi:hypothetical protein
MIFACEWCGFVIRFRHVRRPHRNSPPAILLRESYREGDKIKSRPLASLWHWPDDKINVLGPRSEGHETLRSAFEAIL